MVPEHQRPNTIRSFGALGTPKSCISEKHVHCIARKSVAMPPHHLGDNSALAIPLHALVDPMLQLHPWVSWNIQGTPQKVTNTTFVKAGGWKRCFLSWAMLQIWHHWIFTFSYRAKLPTSTHGTRLVCPPPPPVLLQRLHDNVTLQSHCRIHTLRALKKQMSDRVFKEKQSLKLLKHIGCYWPLSKHGSHR